MIVDESMVIPSLYFVYHLRQVRILPLLRRLLFLLASARFGWLAAADAYPVLDLLTARLARTASTGLAHINLPDSR